MPLGVGKISWVQCGRVTNLKETNISLYNLIMIWISGSTGSSPEPCFEWFLELRPGRAWAIIRAPGGSQTKMLKIFQNGCVSDKNEEDFGLHPSKWARNEVNYPSRYEISSVIYGVWVPNHLPTGMRIQECGRRECIRCGGYS